MNGLRVALGTLGVGVAIAGLAMVLEPSLAGLVPSGDQVIHLLGLLAIVQGGRILWHRYKSDLEVGTIDADPEAEPARQAPGSEFDELVTAAGNVESGRALRSRRSRLRRRLRRAIVAALSRRQNLDGEEAADAIESGTWTDDPEAAALFTDEVSIDGSSGLLSLPESGPATLSRRADRAAFAVGEQVGVDRDADEDASDESGGDR